MIEPLDPPSPEVIATIREWAGKADAYLRKKVDEAIEFVRMGLGNPPKLDAARDAWNVTATGHVANGTNAVVAAFPDLRSRWSGPAFTAFEAYYENIRDNVSPKVSKALIDVGDALTSAKNEVISAYNSVVTLMERAATAILEFVGSVAGSIQVDLYALAGGVAQGILTALSKFVSAYTEAVKTAMTNIAGYKTAANKAASAIAQLGQGLMPALPQAAGDPSSYVPAKAR